MVAPNLYIINVRTTRQPKTVAGLELTVRFFSLCLTLDPDSLSAQVRVRAPRETTFYAISISFRVSFSLRENVLQIIEFSRAVLNWNYSAKRFRCCSRCQGRFHLTISSRLLFGFVLFFFGLVFQTNTTYIQVKTCAAESILNRISLPHEKKRRRKKRNITVPAGNIFSNNNNTRHETDNKLNYETSKKVGEGG